MAKKPKPQAPPVVKVTWHDAVEDFGDVEPGAVPHKPAIQHTAGFLARDDAKGVSIAAEWNGDGSGFRTVTFIPRGMVVRVRRFR